MHCTMGGCTRFAVATCVAMAAVSVGAPARAGNIIVNGSFSSGTSGFSSDYTYTPGPNTDSAQYNIVTNASSWNAGFYALPGPSGAGDPYYAGNGAGDVSLVPWYQTVSGSSVTGVTVTGTNVGSPVYYRFEALLSNLVPFPYAPPGLFFEINVDGQGWKNFTNSYSTPYGNWGVNYVDTYFASAPTSLGFRLRNYETAFSGNDFAVDNLYFGLMTESPSYGNGYTTIRSAGEITNPSFIGCVPEIDPAGFGSVAALITGAIGLIERRRLKKTAA